MLMRVNTKGRILDRAAQLIATPQHWTQCRRVIKINSIERVCADEALTRANKAEGGNGSTLYSARRAVVKELHRRSHPGRAGRFFGWLWPQLIISTWNDRGMREHKEVLDVLRVAANTR